MQKRSELALIPKKPAETSTNSQGQASVPTPSQQLRPQRVIGTGPTDYAPREAGIAAHCNRVAALAVEIARGIPVPVEALGVVQQAAWLHHASPFELNPSALRRLLKDFLPASAQIGENQEFPEVPQDVAAVVRVFDRFPAYTTGKPGLDILAQVLFVSNLIDEQMELLAWAPASPFDVWESLGELSGLFEPQVIRAAYKTLRSSPKEREAACLSLEAALAKDLLQTLIHQRPDSVSVLADLAARDQVMAGYFLLAANSMINGGRPRVRSLRQAIVQIGTEAARKLLLVLSLRPIFSAAQLDRVWKHSLQTAAYFEAWAGPRGLLAGEDALLLGLVHDVGSIAVESLPAHTMTTFRLLYDGGWAPQSAELLFLGCDHGDLGASLLSSWGLPDHLTEAVRSHHSPAESDSMLASALYAAGYWLEQEEDLPSPRHLDAALNRLGCSIMDLSKAQPADPVLLAAMAQYQ